jgi:hypothetical protein
MYKTYDLKDAEMFSLCDAMRYVSPPVPVPLPLLWIV